MMKKLLMVALVFLAMTNARAQDDQVTFTDEELSRYAVVMVWAELEKSRMGDSVEVWVKSNEKLSAAAYNELSRAAKAGSIDDAEATDEEKAEFSKIQTNIEGQKEAFKEVYVSKIKEDIGAGLYNDLKKALRKDAELKERYQGIYNTLLEAEEGTDMESDTDTMDNG